MQFKISSQYSTYGFIFISYVELCVMPTFQKSMYLDNPELINFYLSINLDASLPQIGLYRIGLGTLVDNFGEPFGLVFHNLIGGPSIKLQTRSVGETLYCITDQPDEINKKSKKMHINMPYQCFGAIFQTTQDPRFKIHNLLY